MAFRQLNDFHNTNILNICVSVKIISTGELGERFNFKLARSHLQQLMPV